MPNAVRKSITNNSNHKKAGNQTQVYNSTQQTTKMATKIMLQNDGKMKTPNEKTFKNQ